MLKRGLIHIYTGDGKGKTTAALGLAVRAAGSGLKVVIYQFVKKRACGESRIMDKIRNIKIIQCGRGPFIKGVPKQEDIRCARLAFKKARKAAASGAFDLVILDEANIAMSLGLLDEDAVVELIKNKAKDVEIVFTGRGSPNGLLKYADYVTEFKKLKHPFDRGILARRGIEY